MSSPPTQTPLSDPPRGFAYQARLLERTAARVPESSPLRPTSSLRHHHGLGTQGRINSAASSSPLAAAPSDQAPALVKDTTLAALVRHRRHVSTPAVHLPPAPTETPQWSSNHTQGTDAPLPHFVASDFSPRATHDHGVLSSSTSSTGRHHASISLGGVGDLTRSSVSGLKTLGSYAPRDEDASSDGLSLPGITDEAAQDVTGLAGRVRLARFEPVSEFAPHMSYTASLRWMDKQRHLLKAYEYLCHCGEARDWISSVLSRDAKDVSLPPIVEMEERMRDGVLLAQVARAFAPQCVPRVFSHPRLQFKHTDNINYFFSALHTINLPDFFCFELTDLYEKKNFPKVIYCLHALSHFLARGGTFAFRVGNLYGQLEFTQAELERTHRNLEGKTMPKFGGLDRQLGEELDSVPPSPEETEEERIERLKKELSLAAPDYIATSIVRCQAAARSALARQKAEHWRDQKQARDDARIVRTWAPEIQRLIRGGTVRRTLAHQRQELLASESNLVFLQAAARGALARRVTAVQLNDLDNAARPGGIIRKMQAVARGSIARAQLQRARTWWQQEEPMYYLFQALCRGGLARQKYQRLLIEFRDAEASITGLQAVIRGQWARREAHDKLMALKQVGVQDSVLTLQSFVRAVRTRRGTVEQRAQLRLVTPNVTTIQAQIRGVLIRLQYRWWRKHLRLSELVLIFLQALLRGAMVRKAWRTKRRYWQECENDIVLVQSIWRTHHQAGMYRSLKQGTGVSVEAVRSFSYLLSDSNADWSSEIEVGRLRRLVARSSNELTSMKHDLADLDRRIALLVKNAIDIEELNGMKSERGLFGTGSISGSAHAGTSGSARGSRLAASGDPFAEQQYGLPLGRRAQVQLELYQTLFFLLHSRPVYLARLHVAMCHRPSQHGTAQEGELVERIILTIFGYGQDERDEVQLLRLLKECARTEAASSVQSAQELVSRVVITTRTAGEKYYLTKEVTQLLTKPVKYILDHPDLDLDTEPRRIWITVHSPGSPLPPVNVMELLQDPETRSAYIEHLQSLRALADEFVRVITSCAGKLPYGLRYLGRSLLQTVRSRFPDQGDNTIIPLLAHALFRLIFVPALLSPIEHGLLPEGESFSPRQKAAAGKIIMLISDAAKGKGYDVGEGRHALLLEPLNDFVLDAGQRLATWAKAVADAPELEAQFPMADVQTVTDQLSRAIDVSPSDVYALHSLMARNLSGIVDGKQDVLIDVMERLGSAPPLVDQRKMGLITAHNDDVTLEMMPHDLSDPEAEERALWVETKRLVLNVLRVQSGPTLFAVLLKDVIPEDEDQWKAVAHAEREQEEANAMASRMGRRPIPAEVRAQQQPSELSLEDLRQMSFADLKVHTLQHVKQLEDSGRITRDRGFQDLLEAIAHDIGLKSMLRARRKAQIGALSASLVDLAKRKDSIAEQILSYNSVLMQSVTETQRRGTKRRSAGGILGKLNPWSTQAKHERHLHRAGQLPAFGSFVFSPSKLVQRGVLLAYEGGAASEASETARNGMDVTLASDTPGEFKVSLSPAGSGASLGAQVVLLSQLLEMQLNGENSMQLLDGRLTADVSSLIDLLNKKFFASGS